MNAAVAASVAAPVTTSVAAPGTTATRWVPVCRVADIAPLGARRVDRSAYAPGAAQVAVFRAADDQVFALLDRCPHKGGPLSQGIVFGHSVACPLHNWTIDLADGQARAPDVGCAARFSVRLEAGVVMLDAEELRRVGVGSGAGSAGGSGAGSGAVSTGEVVA